MLLNTWQITSCRPTNRKQQDKLANATTTELKPKLLIVVSIYDITACYPHCVVQTRDDSRSLLRHWEGRPYRVEFSATNAILTHEQQEDKRVLHFRPNRPQRFLTVRTNGQLATACHAIRTSGTKFRMDYNQWGSRVKTDWDTGVRPTDRQNERHCCEPAAKLTCRLRWITPNHRPPPQSNYAGTSPAGLVQPTVRGSAYTPYPELYQSAARVYLQRKRRSVFLEFGGGYVLWQSITSSDVWPNFCSSLSLLSSKMFYYRVALWPAVALHLTTSGATMDTPIHTSTTTRVTVPLVLSLSSPNFKLRSPSVACLFLLNNNKNHYKTC